MAVPAGELPAFARNLTLKARAKNLLDTPRTLIYDTNATIGEVKERSVRVGRDYKISLTYSLDF